MSPKLETVAELGVWLAIVGMAAVLVAKGSRVAVAKITRLANKL